MSLLTWMFVGALVSVGVAVYVWALNREDQREYYRESDDDSYGC